MDVIHAQRDQCALNLVQSRIKPLLHRSTTFLDSQGPLTRATITSLEKTFDRIGHRPSQSMWEALTDVAATLEAMANDTCPPLYYLSSLDPGVGKTQTVIHFIKALLTSLDHQGVGVLLCVSRLDEVRSALEELSLKGDDVSVFTSDQELNALGGGRIRSARVLLTTQQMVEARTRNKTFGEMDLFHHLGRPRQVRIWDETILPGKTITLGRDDIASLLRPLRGVYSELVTDLELLFTKLKDAEDGDVYQIPDFASDHDVDLQAVLEVLQGGNASDLTVAESLWFLSGKMASVRQDGVYGSTVLSYKETLPIDLPPVLVLDASGRVRGTYPEWEHGRGNLIRLREAPKAYDKLSINVWPVGGGKSAFRRNGSQLVDGIASTINRKPDEEWLVIHHKPAPGMPDIETEVRELIVTDQEKVNFMTWGNHQATNIYSHVPNVILAGTLFYRSSIYEALGRLSAGKMPEHGIFPEDSFKRIKTGEHSHMVLQALCRGSVRRCVGHVCSPCEAYIIASPRSGIGQSLRRMFPGCRVKPWRPVKKALSGKVKESVEFVVEWFKENPDGFLKFTVVREVIGITDPANFKHKIREHPDFQQALLDHYIIEDGGAVYMTGFRKMTGEWLGFQEVEDGWVSPLS